MLEMAIQETVFLISAFTSLLSLEQVYVLSRNMPGDFTRKKGKMQLQRLLRVNSRVDRNPTYVKQ